MEEEQDIIEEIEERLEVVEEVDEPLYTDDEDLHQDIDITPELYDADAENTPRDAFVPKRKDTTNVIRGGDTRNVNIKRVTDAVDKSTVALIKFSDDLAENILDQAVLISEIYTKDTLNVISRPDGAKDRINVVNGNIGRHLPSGGTDENGCDRYLLDKLLRSQPDMDDAPVNYEGFSGEEVNFKSDPDVNGAVNGAGDVTDAKKDVNDNNDNNNNKLDANTTSMLSENDNYLETIHEDTELVLEHPDVKDEIRVETTDNLETKKDNSDDKAKLEIDDFIFDTATEKSEPEYYSESSEDESEGEEDCCEMTFKEKRAVVKAVRRGNIDKVELLLEKRRADLDMVWYGENLLMIAIRADRERMAEFLIDNDIDLAYKGSLIERSENGDMTLCTYTAREMAFDKDMDDVVEVIDFKTNNLFPFVKPREREIRLRRPRPPTPSPTPEEETDEDVFYDPEADVCLLNDPNLDNPGSEINCDNRSSGSRQDSESNRLLRSRQEERVKTRTSVTSKYEDESVTTKRSVSKHSGCNFEIHDDISHVFGQDEGYETMSSVSPVALAPVHKLERNFIGTKDYVSVRGTRSSHYLKIRNSSSRGRSRGATPECESVHEYVTYPIQSVGSYNRESRRWHQTKSAPARHSVSVESIPDTSVHLGLPFVHGKNNRSNSASSTNSDTTRQRSHSAKSNMSPYSHVMRLLSESKLLNSNSSSSLTHLPEVRTEPLVKRKDTRTSYTCIYANTTSSIPGRTIYSYPGTTPKSVHTDLHTKNKLRA